MTSPFIWIIIPIIIGVILIFLQEWEKGVAVIGTLTALVLALAAWLLPFERAIIVGSRTFTLEYGFSIAGIDLVISPTDRSLLIMLYSVTAFILGGSIVARTQRKFVPIGLILIAILIAALSIEPLIYGALFFLLAILLYVLILTEPGYDVSKGVLRFLIFQIIGLAFILSSGWLLVGGVDITQNFPALMRVTLILGIGFAFLFSIFPLYAWVTMIAEESHPYSTVFVCSMVFGSYTLYLISFLDSNQWLLEISDIFGFIRFVGVLMVGTGGVWAAFQRNLGRLMGYAVVIEVGHALISIGVQYGELHYSMLVPRIISMALWGLGLSILSLYSNDLNFRSVQGMARRFPVAGSALLLAQFSLAGFPLLAGFPTLLSLWKQLANISLVSVFWGFLGSIGLLVGGFRSLAVLTMGPEELSYEGNESFLQKVYLLIGIIAILLFGIFPHLVHPIFIDLVGSIEFINP